MSVALLFVDGLGLGERDPRRNPFARFPSRFFDFFLNEPLPELPYGGCVLATAVDMGIPGLPQSATGQTALLCGLPAAQITGHHIPGFPTPTLRRLLDNHSLFRKLRHAGKCGTFANALSQEYFDQRGERISATSRALLAGGFPWRSFEDLRCRRAVSHDLTNEFLRRLCVDVPLRTAMESAQILVEIIAGNDFTLFEFVLTDLVGHRQDMSAAAEVIELLSTLLTVVLGRLDLRSTTVIMTSDHGNFEDLSVKTHTSSPVPTLVWGAGQPVVSAQVKGIDDIAGAIVQICVGNGAA